jgi:hypothetical protein
MITGNRRFDTGRLVAMFYCPVTVTEGSNRVTGGKKQVTGG